jgi:[protein-PII] uridylyltransferase
VLAAILPSFRRVVGRMQYDLFHVYTVDEHTLRVLRNIARFADPQAREELPLACETFAALQKPELLLLAALFHDIAKGRGGDHSELGEVEARAFCSKLGIADAGVELVAWLVRWHLLMSVTAQRQDITDPDVVHRFAIQVEDRERLDTLYLLTISDIAGTNPKLWNEWKARLLADLYVAARYALRADLRRPPQADARAAACRARAQELLVDGGMDAVDAVRLLVDFPEASFLRHPPERVAWQAQALALQHDPDAATIAIMRRSTRGSSVLFVGAKDRDGLFAAIAATLDRLGCNVVAARLLVAADGRVFDTFELLDSTTLAALDEECVESLELQLRRALAASDLKPHVVRRGLPRRLRHFQRVPQIAFAEAGHATQLALVCSDGPGLLAQVAQAFRTASVRVHDARIATFGERVEDFFILSDENDEALTEPVQAAVRRILMDSLGAANSS